MAHILCSNRRIGTRELDEVIARLQPRALHRFAIQHRNDEDEVHVTPVIAHTEADARQLMEQVLGRTDFTVHALD